MSVISASVSSLGALAAEANNSTAVGPGEAVTFWILAPVAVLAALGLVLSRKAVHSALWLAVVMLCLGVFYVVQSGPFLGLAQIIIYTGAIMMLFLFVLMLVGRSASESVIEVLRGQRIAAVVLGLGFAGLAGTAFYRALASTPAAGLEEANAEGNVQGIANLLFTRYLLAFEATSALLITAAVAAMLLAYLQRSREQRTSQADRMRARFAPGNYPAPKPGPGVYATAHSVSTPARLPDGQPSEESVNKLLAPRELSDAEAAPKGTDGR